MTSTLFGAADKCDKAADTSHSSTAAQCSACGTSYTSTQRCITFQLSVAKRPWAKRRLSLPSSSPDITSKAALATASWALVSKSSNTHSCQFIPLLVFALQIIFSYNRAYLRTFLCSCELCLCACHQFFRCVWQALLKARAVRLPSSPPTKLYFSHLQFYHIALPPTRRWLLESEHHDGANGRLHPSMKPMKKQNRARTPLLVCVQQYRDTSWVVMLLHKHLDLTATLSSAHIISAHGVGAQLYAGLAFPRSESGVWPA